MAQNDNQFPPGRQPRLRRIPEESSLPKLLDNDALEDLLGRLDKVPTAVGYPLQISFYEKLLHCDLLLPVPRGTQLQKGIPILTLENMSGEKALPVFTAECNLALWADDNTDYITLPFATLCGYAMEAKVDYLLINVAGPYGCEISFYDFSYLAEGLLPPPSSEQANDTERKPGEILIEKNTPMRLSQCQGLPNGLMERLQHFFGYNQALISRVYLFEVAFNQGPMQPALGIRMLDGCEPMWEQELWPTLQAVLHEMLERRAVVNVFLLNEAGQMESHLQEMIQPLFTGANP